MNGLRIQPCSIYKLCVHVIKCIKFNHLNYGRKALEVWPKQYMRWFQVQILGSFKNILLQHDMQNSLHTYNITYLYQNIFMLELSSHIKSHYYKFNYLFFNRKFVIYDPPQYHFEPKVLIRFVKVD